MDFITNEEATELGLSKDKVNKILERVYNLAIEKALCNLPELLNHLSKRQAHLQGLYTKFFAEHPQYVEQKAKVAEAIQSLELLNPGDTPEQIFEKLPKKLRDFALVSKEVKVTPVDLAKLNESVNGVL